MCEQDSLLIEKPTLYYYRPYWSNSLSTCDSISTLLYWRYGVVNNSEIILTTIPYAGLLVRTSFDGVTDFSADSAAISLCRSLLAISQKSNIEEIIHPLQKRKNSILLPLPLRSLDKVGIRRNHKVTKSAPRFPVHSNS